MPSTTTIAQTQVRSLDDTDPYASVWEAILDRQRQQQDCDDSSSNDINNKGLWGGRGKGGRGLARRTVQPKTVVVDDIRLQYLHQQVAEKGGNNKAAVTRQKNNSNLLHMLEGATLKLLPNHIYALLGRNGSGKSTLLQRMHQQKLPGWSIQWSTVYLPPSLPPEHQPLTPRELLHIYLEECHQSTKSAMEARIHELEAQLDALNVEEEPETTETLCGEISQLEEQLVWNKGDEDTAFRIVLKGELDIDPQQVCQSLSLGQQKEVLLCIASICSQFTTLLLLDEPANDLDVYGLLRLRRILESVSCTVVMVSHDVDLINDVATDIIEIRAQKLWYFPGNYDSYRLMKEQMETHQIKQSLAAEKKRDQLRNTLQHLKDQPTPRRGGSKKKAKSIAAQRKKMEWHEKDAVSSDDLLPERMGLTVAQRVRLAQTMKSVPDKAVQFAFASTPSQWGEPLIVAYDVGYQDPTADTETNGPSHQTVDGDPTGEHDNDEATGTFQIVKRDRFLFDCVDLCIEEGTTNCILGPGISASYLLKILTRKLAPTEGTVHHASGVKVAFIDSKVLGQLREVLESTSTTALDFLMDRFPETNQEQLRGHLTSYGLSSTSQTKTPLCCLSGGETFRFVLAKEMMHQPPVLCLDSPTSHLDVESVQALAYGLRQWNGTLVMVCHDASFLRILEDVKCVVIVPEEGKVRRIVSEKGMGSMDSYLKSLR